ncbi:hypothetical protein D9613_003468 [Agrocybe pediades]|uniref:G domain-containing protein n=1 Tax=Agrocybe pediades TaxID=84607 RepID=A0A8H4QQZ0_9AGAR|nr:hypothetical protein D9613_003468 [Agrocybe pediades]
MELGATASPNSTSCGTQTAEARFSHQWCILLSLAAPNLKIFMPRASNFRKQSADSRQEIIILIMGATRAGKSTFFNYLVQDEHLKSKLGDTMASCTSQLHPITLTSIPDDPFLQQYTIVLVDTPGFDDTMKDTDTFKLIRDWLENACALFFYLSDDKLRETYYRYRHKKILGGIIYLHDISSDRLLESAQNHIKRLGHLCGGASFSKVIIGTTKWNHTTSQIRNREKHEELKQHLRPMLEKGAEVKQFEGSYDSAVSFIEQIVKKPRLKFEAFWITLDTKTRKNRLHAASIPEIIIIPIMGATGAGKSTFLNYLVQDERQKFQVGHKLTSCTSELRPVTLTFPNDPFLRQYTVILVDTPGFDDTYAADVDILERIANWLKNAHRDMMVVGGVIYLHDISNDRFSGTARRNLEMFNRMCGDNAFKKVIIGTTKWRRTPPSTGERRENELKEVHWRPMLEKGASTKHFEDSYDSCLAFIRQIVEDKLLGIYLTIQKEMVDDKKIIPETQAGMELRFTLREVLDMQRKILELEKDMTEAGDDDAIRRAHQEARQRMDALMLQIEQLKIPFFRKLMKFLGIL